MDAQGIYVTKSVDNLMYSPAYNHIKVSLHRKHFDQIQFTSLVHNSIKGQYINTEDLSLFDPGHKLQFPYRCILFYT